MRVNFTKGDGSSPYINYKHFNEGSATKEYELTVRVQGCTRGGLTQLGKYKKQHVYCIHFFTAT